MSIYPNVTQQDKIKLRKMAEQQKDQRAENIFRKLKQIQDKKIAENFPFITKNLSGIKNILKK